MQEKYLVASNSAGGFCSYYENAFDTRKFSKIYVIKGGSGTGKAFFMRRVAQNAEKYGYSVRYIYCSSDAESLDAVIINELKVAVLDGTSPHVYEPHTIGAVESFVNLGDFLDEAKLSKNRALIERVTLEKQKGFVKAYRALASYKSLSDNIADMVKPTLNFEKINKFALKFVDNVEKGTQNEEILLVRAIGMRGLSSFDTYYELAEIYYEIEDYFESAHFLTNEIYLLMKQKGVDIRISRHPIIPSRIDALRTEREGLTFEIGNGMNDATRRINMKRFIDVSQIQKIRQDYRATVRARDYSLDVALAEFEKVKEKHFILERIYGSAMDFVAKEQFTDEFCKKIFQNN